jgi:hypothetical protein
MRAINSETLRAISSEYMRAILGIRTQCAHAKQTAVSKP